MELLGPVVLWCGDQRAEITAGKVRGVVAILALRAPSAAPAAGLIDSVWGDAPPPSAGNALQVYISTIRRSLRSVGAVDVRQLVSATPAGYALAVGRDDVDASRFERLVDDGSQALEAGDAARAHTLLRAALDCWHGDRALADVDDDVAGPIRTRLDDLRLRALELEADARLALGAAGELVDGLEALVQAHPYRESLWERLMLALYRSGRQADALRTMQRARRLLADDLGVDPGPGLVRMEAAILEHDPSVAPLTRAAHAETAAAPPSPAVVRPASSGRRILGLAAPPGTLIGRERDVDELVALFDDPTAQIVTLVGPGGIGKTRLALEVADAGLRRFDLVAFVDLAAVTQSTDVAPAIATTLGGDPGVDAVQAVAALLADVSALIVLDNLEQVHHAAPVVGELAARLPHVRLLATSRSPLRLAAERSVQIRPLSIDDARRLFVARAGLDTADVGDERDSLTRICERLDRIPLALELAAARIRLLALDALDERLDRYGFSALGRGVAGAPERHQTMGAAIAWSVDLLDPPARQLYEAMGCFQGGATLDAIEAVTRLGEPMQLLDCLDVLVDASLVTPPDLHGPAPRIGMLETIRQDAATRLAARADADEVLERHVDHYTSAAGKGLLGVDDLPNVRLAMTRLFDSGRLDSAANLALDARRLFFDGGLLVEMRDVFARLDATGAIDAGTHAKLTIVAQTLHYLLDGRCDAGAMRDAIAALRERGDFDPIAINGFCYLGAMAVDTGELAAADEFGREAEGWAVDGADPEGESMALDFRAYVARSAGDAASAAELMGRAVDVTRPIVVPPVLSQRLSSYAQALAASGEDALAEAAAREALELALSTHAKPAERDAWSALGESVRHAAPGRAVAYFARAATLSFDLSQPGVEEMVRLARALFESGDVERASLMAGAAGARRTAMAVNDPESARVLGDLAGHLDDDRVSAGAGLDQAALAALLTTIARADTA